MVDEVRVLIVDDSPDAADMLACALELDGFQVRVAGDGVSALPLVADFQPHCVLLDVEMPGLDGYELAKRLRELYADDIVLIAVTGRAADDDRVKGTFRIVDHYFTKPVDPVRLKKVMRPFG
ncbi:MAG: response regulator [Pseudomonadota bacterium]